MQVLLATAAGAAMSLAAWTAEAQSNPPAPPRPAPVATSGSGIQDVVVTARRHEENAQTVPVTVKAFGAKALTEAGVRSTNDLQMLVPGIILNGAGADANTTYTIRGQGKAVIGAGLPSVINYFNEVPMPSWGSVLPTFDVSSAQVLKGPQGTLFGRNTTGGAVLVYSTPPTFAFGGYVQGEVGDYNDYDGEGAVNIPIVPDKLAVRVAGDFERRDGYTKDLTTHQEDDNINSDAVRLSVLFTPVNWLTNTFVADYYYTNTRGPGEVPLTMPAAIFQTTNYGAAYEQTINAAVTAQRALGGPYVRSSSTPTIDRDELWGISNTTKADFGPVTFKNIFGYRSNNIYDQGTGTGLGDAPLPDYVFGKLSLGLQAETLPALPFTPSPLTGSSLSGVLINTVTGREDRQISDEAQLSGSALDRSLNWLVGAFYLDDAPTGPDYLLEDVFRPTGSSVSPALTTYVNTYLGGTWPLGALANNLFTDESKAVFGNVSYDLSNLAEFLHGFTLNAGLRYTWDTEGVCGVSFPTISFATGKSFVPPVGSLGACQAAPGAFSQSVSFSAPTYTFGIDYKVNDNVFLYFTTRRGYRAGGLNAPSFANSALAPFQTYQPQYITDYEIGAHTRWQAGGWTGRFNIDAFVGYYTNLQLQATGITAGSGIKGINNTNAPANTAVTLNAGAATISGFDVDGAISPFSDLVVSYGLSYLNAEYTKLTVPGFLSSFFSSGPFTGAPRWSYFLDGRYRLPTPADFGDFYLNVDFYHVDQEFQGYASLPAYDLTNFSLEWANIGNKSLSATVFVNNAFNTLYIHNVELSTSTFGVFAGNYAPPRMFGVRLRYEFGE
jgi:iron complex outermembrane recepter protein